MTKAGSFGMCGVFAVFAILGRAPIANADDPSCDQQPPDQQQECQQQQQLPGTPQLPKNHDPSDSNPQQLQQEPPQPAQPPQKAPQQSGIDLSDKNCWVVNGVPTMWNPAIATGPGDVVGWCPQVYGLRPH